MTDALQTIALAVGFLPAVVLLWFRVSRLMREVEEMQRQAMITMLADDLRRNPSDSNAIGGGWRDYDAIN